MKWSVLPVALLIRGTLAMAQSQTPEPQGSSSFGQLNHQYQM
jgi:hypothetical protein